MGAALASTVTRRPWQQFLGGCLFALSPVLVARLGHDTLCAHWLLIGLLYLGLRDYPDAASARRAISWLATGAAMLSAAIHPYLAVMCWVLAHALFVRLWRSRRITLARAASAAARDHARACWPSSAPSATSGRPARHPGVRRLSSDLLTLVNPMGYSRLLPSSDVPTFQWEGFGFLGAGGIVLSLVAPSWSSSGPPAPGGTSGRSSAPAC